MGWFNHRLELFPFSGNLGPSVFFKKRWVEWTIWGPWLICWFMIRNPGLFSPNSVVTLGVLTVIVKSRVARSRWRTGGAQISSLFSWFRAYMFVSPVNSRSFGLAAATRTAFVCKFSEFPALQLLRCSFFVVILVLFGDLRCSWKGLKRVSSVNFRTFSALQLLQCSFFVVILVLFGVLQWSWTVFLQ